ncbi:MAG TPA: hypothetical protein PKH83_02170 [Cyclobacteriaceae bacterium]|nr:hypothetical protein [Cyclobacteriaceae bacterium]HNU41270.1 hypothetical protein [Cyclobacteriaceae bacterium]
MDQIYKDFEKTIKTKHSFRWTPKYKTTIETTLKKEIVTEVASKAFEKLGWELIHKDKETTEAHRKNSYGTWTEKIIVKSLVNNKVEIESITLGNEMWDFGRNSKWVKLFEFAFKNHEKDYDIEKQIELEKEVKRKDNWDDYVIPTSLPQPVKRIEPTFAIPVTGGIFVSILAAYIIAYVSVNGIYIIGFYESIIGFGFGLSLKYLIKWSNFTNGEKLHYLIYAMIALFFFANQIFQYEIVMSKNNITGVSFMDFIKFKFENGLKIKSVNTGWIGLIISWVFQILVIYWITVLKTFSSLLIYQSERVPSEVIDFAYYHFVKGKSEQEVRLELAKMGWNTDLSQNEVIESIGAIGERQDFIRSR